MKKSNKIKWRKREHELFKRFRELNIVSRVGDFSQWHWMAADFSIISPSFVTRYLYELYDGEETYRFETLEEAKKYAETLNSKK